MDPSDVVTGAAYCLYYQLRDWKPDPAAVNGGTSDSALGDDLSDSGTVSREMGNFKLDEREAGDDDMHVEVNRNGGATMSERGDAPMSADGYDGDDDERGPPPLTSLGSDTHGSF